MPAPLFPHYPENGHGVSPEVRFAHYVTVTESCWLWDGTCDTNGYGLIRVDGRCEKAHRYAYQLFKGDIPEGYCVCHTCDDVRCVYPGHLWLGTHDDNMKDCVRKGRRPTMRGDDNGHTMVPDAAVPDIREEFARGIPLTELARRYGVTHYCIFNIVHGKTRKHLGGAITPSHKPPPKPPKMGPKRRVLTKEDVYRVIELLSQGLTQTEVAKIVGTSQSNVSDIWRRRIWAHHPERGALKDG